MGNQLLSAKYSFLNLIDFVSSTNKTCLPYINFKTNFVYKLLEVKLKLSQIFLNNFESLLEFWQVPQCITSKVYLWQRRQINEHEKLTQFWWLPTPLRNVLNCFNAFFRFVVNKSYQGIVMLYMKNNAIGRSHVET